MIHEPFGGLCGDADAVGHEKGELAKDIQDETPHACL
jgi:hypothetical protein